MVLKFTSSLLLMFVLLFVLETTIYSQIGSGVDSIRGLTATAESEVMVYNGQQAADTWPVYNLKSMTIASQPAPEGTLIDEINFELYLEAGKHFAFSFDHNTKTLTQWSPSVTNTLTGRADAALNKAPQWLRLELHWVFSQLPAASQDLWAAVINDANDPYVDEIAFCIARSSPQYLQSEFGDPALFVQNAQAIYENDTYLDYVEIMDVGASDSNDHYYSTAVYVIPGTGSGRRGGGDRYIEVPRDIYYWYIVHPKISDEIPALIDPQHVEGKSHKGNLAPPPVGQFWRSYLFHHADPGYPVLKDRLAGCATAWGGSGLNPSQAVGAINNWINASMRFTSDNERPHQPVRIYDKHIGRCGEYADFTMAACRAALIPCTSILSMSTDHIWNEFWYERWVMWEPVNGYIDTPRVYESSWGKVFGTVFEIRSDGRLRNVTNHYSLGNAAITLDVIDAAGIPVDGAEVRTYIPYGTTSWKLRDFYTLTDNGGQCSLVVGDQLDYFARVDSALGGQPVADDQVLSLVTDVRPGQHYTKTLVVDGSMPTLDVSSVDVPTGDSPYQLLVSFSTPAQITTGDVYSDDVAPYTQYLEARPNGSVDFFMTDEAGYDQFEAGGACDGFNIKQNTSKTEVLFNVPQTGHWYGVLSNLHRLNNLQHVIGSVKVYAR